MLAPNLTTLWLGRLTEHNMCTYNRADSSFVPSQWETSLQSNAISHWLDANLESALLQDEWVLNLICMLTLSLPKFFLFENCNMSFFFFKKMKFYPSVFHSYQNCYLQIMSTHIDFIQSKPDTVSLLHGEKPSDMFRCVCMYVRDDLSISVRNKNTQNLRIFTTDKPSYRNGSVFCWLTCNVNPVMLNLYFRTNENIFMLSDMCQPRNGTGNWNPK